MLNGIPGYFPAILASAAGLGLYDLCKKHAVRDNSVMPTLFYATLTGTAFFFIASASTGHFLEAAQCDAQEFGLIFLKSLIVAGSWTCGYYALRELPISIAAPIRASAPLWVFLGAVMLYREIPTLLQAAGMISIFTGYLVFSLLGKLEGISFRRHRGIHLVAVATLLGAGASLYDKFLLNVQKIPHLTVQFWFSADLVGILGLAWFVRTRCFSNKQYAFAWRWTIPATGILLILADYAYFYAVSLPDAPISILSLLRRTSCVITFVFGAWIFQDRNVRKKAIALLLILTGIVLLALR